MRCRAMSALLCLGFLPGISMAACTRPDDTPATQTKKSSRAPTADTVNPPLSPTKERERIHSEFAASGRSNELWTKNAPTVFRSSTEEARVAGAAVQYSAMECFRAGCLVTATYPDMRHFLESSQSLSESAAFQDWPGTKYRSPPEIGKDGRVVATWGLFRLVGKQASKAGEE